MLVTVTAADADFCGVADVTLHYGLVSSDSMDHPFDRQFLHVTCVTENELCAAAERDTNQGDFYLPTDRDSYEVPITISNGVGQILLTAKSGSGTVYPQVNAVEVNATYQDGSTSSSNAEKTAGPVAGVESCKNLLQRRSKTAVG